MRSEGSWGRLGMTFETVKLSEVADIIVGFAFKSQDFNTDGNGVRLVRGKNITKRSLRWGEDTRWWSDFSIDLSRYFLKENDIVIGMDGSLVGKNYAKITESDLPLLLVQRVACIRAKKGISQEYLWQIIATPVFEKYIDAVKTGTTIPHISGKQIGEYEIPYVDYETQLKISGILSSIEERVLLNTAINENLEQQAQAIFKAWFVDFEPFGRVMPDDWQDISVYDLADYINGAAFKKAEYGDSGLPIIKIAELKSGITDSTQYCCVRKDDKYYIDDRDILFSWSGNPDTSIDTFLWSRGKAILNQHTFRVVSKYNAPAFTYFLLKYLNPQFAHIASNKQTTGLGHVTVADLKRLQFCSNIATINEFEVLAAPIFNAIFAIYKENQHLAVLRDTLLPKLMNGEIDVSAVQI